MFLLNSIKLTDIKLLSRPLSSSNMMASFASSARSVSSFNVGHKASLMQSVTCTRSQLDLLCTVFLGGGCSPTPDSTHPRLTMAANGNEIAVDDCAAEYEEEEISFDVPVSVSSGNSHLDDLDYAGSSTSSLSNFAPSFESDDEFDSADSEDSEDEEDEDDLPLSTLLQLLSKTDEVHLFVFPLTNICPYSY